jgi:diguanylate cyclase (GGDEF)-like protein
MSPRRNRLLKLVLPFVVVVVVQAALAILSFELLSSVRAYVGGEGLWSKGQKDAIHSLKHYALTRDEADFEQFKAAVSVPLADRAARLALEQAEPDLHAARVGFAGGGNHANDIPGMITVFRYLREFIYIATSVSHWRATDPILSRLVELGDELHAEISTTSPDTAHLTTLKTQIEQLDRELAPHALAFTESLSEGSRVVTNILIALNALTAMLLISLAGWHTRKMLDQNAAIEIALNTEREQALDHNARLQAIIDNFPGGISFLDADLRLIVASDGARKLLQFPDELFAGGPPLLEDIFRFNAKRGEYGPGDIEEQVAARIALARLNKAHVFERTRPDGTVIEVRGVPITRGGFITTYTDITERRRSEAAIVHLAYHDPLTQLANRAKLSDKLRHALESARNDHLVAIHLIDLDHFKHVNDSLGHPAGDRLLQEAATRLNGIVSPTDIVARMGGDEFAVVQTEVTEDNEIAALAERVTQSLEQSYEFDGQPMFIAASIGIAVAPRDGATAEQLMRNADLALYASKSSGRNTYRFFHAELGVQAEARNALHIELRNALADEAFEVHYQPVFDIASRKAVSMEALVRWRHPVRGLVPPGEFIALAEETGLIDALGELVLRTACQDARGWPANIKVAINLSSVQFRGGGIVETVSRIVAETGLAPQQLELEITESVLLSGREGNVAALHALRALGVSIALDDFGTGYSSLSYLTTFPLDKIKIDRSFVAGMAERDECAAIVCAIGNLGRSLNVITTAEGVETEEQLELVRLAGFAQAQGYYFGRPQPLQELDFEGAATAPRAADGTQLSTRDVMLVRSTFAQLAPRQAQVADDFYDNLFTLAPELAAMFPENLDRQKRKLMEMIGVCIGRLHQFDSLTETVRALGTRHAGYGVTAAHYALVGQALLSAIARSLGDDFTPDVERAWTKVYQTLASTMQSPHQRSSVAA